MLIRDYRKGDYQEIAALWNETGVGNPARGDTEASVENCLSIGGRLLVMEDPAAGCIIGTSWMTFDGRRLFLHHFCIRPAYQGKGYGNQLTEASLGYIKSTGCQVKLEVHAGNRIARNLYEKYGFFNFEDYLIYMIREVKNIPL
ncbi:MAG: GNAT family N-acetyltransferase [Bacteroidales bacterium]|nr:GNAT family N-acetyltransferase [Bacteroidales bacterium]